MEPANSSDDLAQAKALLNSSVKVTLKDGRVFRGTFQCLDRQGNMILGSAYQHPDTPGRTKKLAEARLVGVLLIPRAHVARVQAQRFGALS